MEHSVLHNPDHAFHALVSSLENTSGESLASQLAFLDNCICRLVKKPVHYQDLLDSLLEEESAPISLLLAAINEQWPFIVKNGNAAQEEAVATWIARFMKALKQAGEDPKALRKVADSLAAQTELKKSKSAIKKALKSAEASDEPVDGDNVSGTRNTQSASKATKSVDLAEVFGSLPTESKSHNVLHKWEKEELELAVEQGQVAGLMLCLCSEHDEIRRQAAVGISRLMMKLKVSFTMHIKKIKRLTPSRIPSTWNGVPFTFWQANSLRLCGNKALRIHSPGSQESALLVVCES